jgi:hypothetical protein
MVPRTFGNTLASMRGPLLFVCIFAMLLWVIFFFLDEMHESLLLRLGQTAKWAFSIAAIPLVAILPTCLFKIRIDSHVSHLFLGATLSQQPVERLRAVEVATGWGVAFAFSDGSKIRFHGAALETLREMCRYLESLRPGQISFSTGIAAAVLLAASDKVKRDA